MRSTALLIVLALAAGCARTAVEAPASPTPAAKAAAAAIADAPPAAATSSAAGMVPPASSQPQFMTVSGAVLETIDASDYTYMRLKTERGEIWAAVTRAKIKKGETVTVVDAMPMDGFESRTLKRKFDRIVFGSLGRAAEAPPAAVAGEPMASAHMASSGPPQMTKEQLAIQHGAAAAGPDETADVKVPKAEGANAKTVVELWAQRAALKGKEVSVRARVVKVTAAVMGKNWLHVRDGSGSKTAKDNDLAVTTDGVAKVGDIVTVSGLISVDKDFGAGYAYPVIIENASLK